MDPTAYFKIGYGLYVVTSSRDGRDNGMICNAVMQVTADPPRMVVAINKANFTHSTLLATGVMNVCALAESAPFALFERFGFQSGRTRDKFAGIGFGRGENGLPVLKEHCCAVFELRIEDYRDLGTHGLFTCAVTAAKTLSDAPAMSYAYYHANVKPKPKASAPTAPGAPAKWVCKICGYVYDPAENDGVAFEDLPADWLCPWCKHPKSDFEKMQG